MTPRGYGTEVSSAVPPDADPVLACSRDGRARGIPGVPRVTPDGVCGAFARGALDAGELRGQCSEVSSAVHS